jgi:hypothetical protein
MRNTIATVVMLMLLAGCNAETRLTRNAGCLHTDSLATALVFSDFSVDSLETWDVSGTRLLISPRSSPWSVDYKNAEGEWGIVHQGGYGSYDPRSARLSLNIPHGPGLPDTVRFVGYFSCDSIWGQAESYAGLRGQRQVYRREVPSTVP